MRCDCRFISRLNYKTEEQNAEKNNVSERSVVWVCVCVTLLIYYYLLLTLCEYFFTIFYKPVVLCKLYMSDYSVIKVSVNNSWWTELWIKKLSTLRTKYNIVFKKILILKNL